MSQDHLPPDDSLVTPSGDGEGSGQHNTELGDVPSLVSVFRRHGSFSDVDDATLKKFEQHMRLLEFHDGEIICREGTRADWTFVITTGQVEVVKTAPNGALIVVNVLGPGEWAGIMGMTGQGPRMARLLARGQVTVRAIDHLLLMRLMAELPGISAGLLGCLVRRISEASTHLTATLQHVRAVGLDDIAEHSSPRERLMLDTIRHRVAAAESPCQIMDFVFDSIPHEDDVRMTLTFLEDAGGRVVSQWSRATYEPMLLPPDYEEDLVGGLMEESHRTSKPTIVNDLETFACNHPFNQGAVKRVKEGLQSSMIAPLRIGNRTVGFLVRSVRTINAFDDHQLRIHQAIADSISPVVEKAYRIEMLTAANKDYAEVLGFISHELQSPIASMVTDAKLMEGGYLGELNEKQKDKIGRSIRNGMFLLTMIRDFLNLARLEEGSIEADLTTEIDLKKEVIQPVLELLQSDSEAKEMSVSCQVEPPLPRVTCDVGLLRIAVGNLLRNAITYGRKGGKIRVSLQPDTEGPEPEEMLSITVWNEGPGFSPSQRPQLFRKFSRLDDPELKKKRGTGIGLYLTWRIMQLHHGRATARSLQGHWAEFKLTLPQDAGRLQLEHKQRRSCVQRPLP